MTIKSIHSVEYTDAFTLCKKFFPGVTTTQSIIFKHWNILFTLEYETH